MRTHTLSMVHRSRALCATLAGAALLAACSPRDAAEVLGRAGGASPESAGTVVIVRETRKDSDQAYLRMQRHLLNECMEAAAGTAHAQGRSYDPRNDAMTDEEILAVDSERTEEYFDGRKYRKVVEWSQHDSTNWGMGPGQHCRLKTQRTKSVSIYTADCRSIYVVYDMNNGTVTSVNETGPVCNPWEGIAGVPAQPTGEVMQLPADVGRNLQCRWNLPAGSRLVRHCLLEPLYVYPYGRRDLIVAHESTNTMAPPNSPIESINRVTAGVAAYEVPLRVEVGTALPAELFEAPADTRGVARARP